MRYRFTDPDRERLGITDEWVEFDIARLMFDEAMNLESAGYDVDEFLEDFRGHPREKRWAAFLQEVHAALHDPEATIEDLRTKLPADINKIERRVPLKAIGAAAWIAAHRGGSTVSFADFTFDMAGLRNEVEPEGKDDSPDPASES